MYSLRELTKHPCYLQEPWVIYLNYITILYKNLYNSNETFKLQEVGKKLCTVPLIENRSPIVIKRAPTYFSSNSRQMQKITLAGWASTNVLTKNNITLKKLKTRDRPSIPYKFKDMFIAPGHFKASIATSLLDVFTTIVPAHFCRASCFPLFASRQHAQTPAQYCSIGLVIDLRIALALCVVI